jgi:hypothetical protein
MTKCFVGGTVVHDVHGVEECAAGAEVVVRREGREVGRAVTDAFGEFKIDGLEPGSGRYEIEASGASGRVAMQFGLGEESRYLGAMKLVR